jgi:hypothetical protein
MYPEVDEETMLKLTNRWGGIPRGVLEKWDDGTFQNSLEEAIGEMTFNKLMTAGCAGGETSGSTDLASDKIFHIKSDSTFQEKKLEWASSYVREKVMRRLDVAGKLELQQWLAHSAHDPEYGALRGLLFEAFVHSRFEQGESVSLKMRPLDPKGAVGETRSEWKVVETERFRKVKNLASMRWGVYYLPMSKTEAAMDAFMVTGQSLVAMQITVAENHPVKMQPLQDLSAVVARCGEEVSTSILAFMVPPDRYPSFQRQTFTTSAGTDAMNLNKAAKTFEQWVVEVPL